MMLRAIMEYGIQWNLSNLDTNGAGESVIVSEVRGVLISEVEMHTRVVLGVGKGVLFREVSSLQESLRTGIPGRSSSRWCPQVCSSLC